MSENVNNENTGNESITEVNNVKKSNKAAVGAGIGVAAVIVAGVAAFAAVPQARDAVTNLFGGDSARVENAVKTTVREICGSNKNDVKKAFTRFYMDSPTSFNINVNYEGEEAGSFVLDRNPDEGLSYCTANVNLLGSKNLVEIYGDENDLYGRIGLAGDEWFKVPKKDVLSKYNDSLLCQTLGVEAEFDEDFSFEGLKYEDIEGLLNASDFYESFVLKYDDDLSNLFKEIGESAEKTEDVYELENGKKAQGYSVELSGSDFADIVRDFGSYYAEIADYSAIINKYRPLIEAFSGEDFNIDEEMSEISESCKTAFNELAGELEETEETIEPVLYIYGGRVVKISIEENEVNLSLECPDGRFDNFIVKCNADGVEAEGNVTADENTFAIDGTVKSDGIEALDLNLDYNKNDGAYTFNFDYNDGYDGRIILGGKGTYMLTENSFDFTVDNLTVDDGDESDSIGDFNVKVKIDALDSSIEEHKPEGGVIYDVFTSDSEEFTALSQKIAETGELLYSLY